MLPPPDLLGVIHIQPHPRLKELLHLTIPPSFCLRSRENQGRRRLPLSHSFFLPMRPCTLHPCTLHPCTLHPCTLHRHCESRHHLRPESSGLRWSRAGRSNLPTSPSVSPPSPSAPLSAAAVILSSAPVIQSAAAVPEWLWLISAQVKEVIAVECHPDLH